MKLAFFDTKSYDKESFSNSNNSHNIKYLEARLSIETVDNAKNCEGIIAFVNCDGSKQVLKKLKKLGIKYWFQRSAGYNNVDLVAATKLQIQVFRVPAYSPEAVAEFAWTLLMAVNRNIHLSYIRASIAKNFTLVGLEGETICKSTVGVIGVGQIGQTFIKISKGLGTRVLVYDDYAKKHFPELAKKYDFEYVNKEKLFKDSDFLSLHCILNKETKYIVNKKTLALMKKNAIIVNTARGDLINTNDLLDALDNKKIRGAGIDVFENEKGIFFSDKSNDLVPDLKLIRLRAHRNVILTAHQSWFTNLAIKQIAKTTFKNIDEALNGNFQNALKIEKNGKITNG